MFIRIDFVLLLRLLDKGTMLVFLEIIEMRNKTGTKSGFATDSAASPELIPNTNNLFVGLLLFA